MLGRIIINFFSEIIFPYDWQSVNNIPIHLNAYIDITFSKWDIIFKFNTIPEYFAQLFKYSYLVSRGLLTV